MKQLLILLISVILFSCSNENKRYHIDETTSPSDTLTYLKFDMSLLNGVVFCDFGENGKYINGKKDGEHKTWFENGQLQSIIQYENGSLKYSGIWTFWNQNGVLYQEMNYENGTLKKWDNNGQLKHSSQYNIHTRNLISEKCWDKNGSEIECK